MRWTAGTNRRLGFLTLVLTIVLGLLAAGVAFANVDSVIKSKKVNGSWRWAPKHDYIKRGDTVRWRVPGTQNAWHDVHSVGGNWNFSVSRLDPGEGKNRTFNSLGGYKYRCVRHSGMVDGKCQGMCGTVHVVA